MTDLGMAYAGEKANQATERALGRMKTWDTSQRITVPSQAIRESLAALDETVVNAKTQDDLLDGLLFVRMLLAAATHS
jgi:hypothetical protein